jgi:hypothetical protein
VHWGYAAMPGNLTAEEWTAIGTWATAAILAITLGIVVWQVREAQKLRREQFRPWVTISFHFRSSIAFIAIRNIGTTAAQNLRLRFEPELVTTLEGGIGDIALLRGEPIPVLAPGEERLILLDQVPDRLKSNLPSRHTAYVEYADHERRPLPPEQFVLDFGLLKGAIHPDKGMHDLVEAAQGIRAGLRPR